MVEAETSALTISVPALIERIEALAAARPAVIAFDGDGTLWSGDVGEDIFEAALDQDALREEALPALRAAALSHAVPAKGTATELARAIFRAYLAGRFPERTVCEVMAWCYAGFEIGELRTFVARTLRQLRIEDRLNCTLVPIVEFARKASIRCVLISASPRFIVEPAAAHWDFAPEDISAAGVTIENGRLTAELSGQLPYADVKPIAGRALFGDADWIASFGDNVFDIDMFAAARIAVAVSPKPALLRLLPSLPQVVVLES